MYRVIEMSRVYDNWDRLIRATLKREQFRELARADSTESSHSSISSDFSSTISLSSPAQDRSLINPEASSGQSTYSYRDGIVEGLPITRSADGILQLTNAKPISFKELKNATRKFRRDAIIGEGGFGHVYKGWIDEHALTAANPGSGTPVAIKSHGFQWFREWLTTVHYLTQLRHPNLIRLIAYCHEGDNMLLIYEFMPRGSLDNHLFGRGHQCLSWATRIKVAVDAARGLSFLHDSRNKVIHRDLCPAHILLDAEFNAKLCGFHLAKDGPPDDETHVSTEIMGTWGYAAPEYVATGCLTEKCDVYGFGVILLELLSGCRAVDRSTGTERKLVDWAKPYLSKKKMVDRVMDAKLEGQYNKKAAVIVANLALQCISHQPKSRPCMAEVLATLERL